MSSATEATPDRSRSPNRVGGTAGAWVKDITWLVIFLLFEILLLLVYVYLLVFGCLWFPFNLAFRASKKTLQAVVTWNHLPFHLPVRPLRMMVRMSMKRSTPMIALILILEDLLQRSSTHSKLQGPSCDLTC